MEENKMSDFRIAGMSNDNQVPKGDTFNQASYWKAPHSVSEEIYVTGSGKEVTFLQPAAGAPPFTETTPTALSARDNQVPSGFSLESGGASDGPSMVLINHGSKYTVSAEQLEMLDAVAITGL